MSERPNFIFFMTDQHRADWLGCYGHPVVKTPHIDAIAAEGTRFENFHVASPICMPNRASFMTGRMPSVHGLRNNGSVLSRNANTFVDVLAAAGYRTASFGKSHLQPFTGLPSLAARGEGSPLIAEAWKDTPYEYEEEEPETYASTDYHAIETPYYGFQTVDMVTLHGDRCGGHYQQWFRAQNADWEKLHDRQNELPHDYTCPQAYRTPVPAHLYPTAYVADRAIDYLNQHAHSDSPLFTYVSFPDPHHPFNPPGKYWNMYSPDDFEIDLPYHRHKNPTPPMRMLEQNYRSNVDGLTPQSVMYRSDRELKEAKALTAGMISCVDDNIGRVIKALKANGQYDNTVICFSTDHGDYLGDYNLLLKGSLQFRSITRVPFIWSDPANRSASVSAALSSTIDISTTVLDRVQLKPYNGIQGLSLLPALQSDDTVREDLLIEFNESSPRLCFSEPVRVRSVVTDEWRYSIYSGQQWGELYHLSEDPEESHNLWDDPDYFSVRARLSERMNHLLMAQMDESPQSVKLA